VRQTIEATDICPYCGKEFYLPSDCKEHVKVSHLDFGHNLRRQVSSQVDVLSELKEGPSDQPDVIRMRSEAATFIAAFFLPLNRLGITRPPS
jgi:hypothetical protein